MKKILSLLLSLTVCLSLAGCIKTIDNSSNSLSDSGSSEVRSEPVETVTETLGNMSYEVPTTWERKDAENGYYYYPPNGVLLQLRLVTDNDGLMDNDSAINSFVDGLASGFEDGKVTAEAYEITKISGHRSFGCTVEGKLDGINYISDTIIVENETEYYFFGMLYSDSDNKLELVEAFTDIVYSATFVYESSVASTEESSTEPPKETATTYSAGMYKVGQDLPAGEYLIDTYRSTPTYIAVTSDSSGNLDSIIMNDNFYNRIYITVSDGQYLSFASGKATPVAETTAYTAEGGLYPSGMYLVGKDIPAGEYKISVEAGSVLGYGYYEVASNSLGVLDSIITNNNISSDTYQTLKDGQYIQLSGTYIQS